MDPTKPSSMLTLSLAPEERPAIAFLKYDGAKDESALQKEAEEFMAWVCWLLVRLWRAGQDSNPRLQAPEACALSWLGIGRNYAFYTRPYPPDIAPNSRQEPIISPACDCRQILS